MLYPSDCDPLGPFISSEPELFCCNVVLPELFQPGGSPVGAVAAPGINVPCFMFEGSSTVIGASLSLDELSQTLARCANVSGAGSFVAPNIVTTSVSTPFCQPYANPFGYPGCMVCPSIPIPFLTELVQVKSIIA